MNLLKLRPALGKLFKGMNPVFFSDHLPPLKKVFLSAGLKIKQAVLFCDKRFRSHPQLKKWRADSRLKIYYISSGEKAKSWEKLSSHIKKIVSLDGDFDRSSLLFISLGGGSLVDLTGFLASIYKRGLPVAHIPTTWLAALDSAHGGKTAVNFQGAKNLLGSYHFPQAVFVVHDFLKQNPLRLKKSACGELIKIAFIEGGSFYKSLKKENHLIFIDRQAPGEPSEFKSLKKESLPDGSKKSLLNRLKKESHLSFIDKFLRPAIRAKMKIVKQDARETRGIRKALNLGHTVGHILEMAYPLPHGEAVLHGLLFSLNWSLASGFISSKLFEEMRRMIPVKNIKKKIYPAVFKKLLRQDKKHKEGRKLDFIFIKKPGAVFACPVFERELIIEAKRQGLI